MYNIFLKHVYYLASGVLKQGLLLTGRNILHRLVRFNPLKVISCKELGLNSESGNQTRDEHNK